jgi:type I site-specific restriction endonuclease
LRYNAAVSEPPLSERDVCTKLIAPALERAGWDIQSQVRRAAKLAEAMVQETVA